MRPRFKTAFLMFAASWCALNIPAYAVNEDINTLLDTPIKDLTNMEVTSVSKRAEKASEAAAAVFVITQEDIRRSGFNNVPEVLRIVPGVQVSRINASWWAITARGNADQFANKLLVLVDGRSVYNPLFSGVLWEEQQLPLEDIERIEVIRGPGSTLYGANAVNGVINIITKSSKDVQGTTASFGVGSFDALNAFYRYGGRINDTDTYKATINHYRQDNSQLLGGGDNFDGFDITRASMRYDGAVDKNAKYTVQSDVYKGSRGFPTFAVPSLDTPTGVVDDVSTHEIYGGNILGKYSKKLSDGSDIDLQAYYDYVGRDAEIFGHKIQTLDLDGQQTMQLSENHQFIWGLGYRLVDDRTDPSDIARYDNSHLTTNLFSGFAQDKIQLVTDELFLTLGSKLEHNYFTGFEVQPNARLTWLASQNQTVWAAVTRAVRVPSYNERTLTQVVAAVPATTYVGIAPNENFDSEKLIAYEIGYRVQPVKDVSLDVTGFINKYDELRTFEPRSAIDSDIGVGLTTANKATGDTRGIELAANWQVTRDWSLAGSYSYLDMDIDLDRDSADFIAKGEDGRSPNNMFNIRSHYKITERLEFDNAIYYVDKIDGAAGDAHGVNDYIRLDARIGFHPSNGVELSLAGQNLLDDRHQEFGSSVYSQPAEIPRSVFAKATFRF